MGGDTTDMTLDAGWLAEQDPEVTEGWALVVAWSFDEPERVGEVAWIPDRGNTRVLGRGDDGDEAGAEARADWVRQRPGRSRPVGPLSGSRISRRQLEIEPRPSGLRVTNVGRCELLVNGIPKRSADVGAGDTLHLKNQLVLLVTRRPTRLPRAEALEERGLGPFGRPDAHGIVGESPVAWALRERLAFLGPRQAHVLIEGESGVGKELAARAVHAMSPRAGRALVARNAATFPPGLIDAELFGNVRDYPNPGMRERRGLVGEAEGSTLLLDEIGELPEELQAHLLRVLDDGEYQRLGEGRMRTADFRLVAATNRGADALKHDLAARLTLRLALPGLNERREDVPLLARHLLEATAADDEAIGRRFFEGWGGERPVPRVAPDLMELLLRHRYTHHVRELANLLWRSMTSSDGRVLRATDEVVAELDQGAAGPRDPEDVTPAEIRAALERNDGNRTRTAEDLRLKNRDVLYRLMKKHGID